MTNVAPVAVQGNLFEGDLGLLRFNKEWLLIGLLCLAVMATAFSVVYTTNQERQLFSQLQTLRYSQERYRIEYGQLLLEQSALATQARIERVAQQKLGMEVPESSRVVLIKL